MPALTNSLVFAIVVLLVVMAAFSLTAAAGPLRSPSYFVNRAKQRAVVLVALVAVLLGGGVASWAELNPATVLAGRSDMVIPMPRYVQVVATTGPNGFPLRYGTPTILSWTAPDDGQLHTVLVAVKLKVGGAMKGGDTGIEVKEVGEPWDTGPIVTGAEGGLGWYHYPANGVSPVLVSPGAVVRLSETTALTQGTATIYAELLAI